MKRVIVFSFLTFVLGSVLVPLYITQMKLKSKRDEYKKALFSIKKTNIELAKKRDILKAASYEVIRKEAIELGLIKEGEKVIRFYKSEHRTQSTEHR